MKLSVIIPVYGAWQPDTVIAALLPLDPLEIIVVDSSPVATPLPRDPRVRLLQLRERAYPGAARNAGWKAAQGEYLLFVDADVVLTGQARDFVTGHIARQPKDMAFGIYSREYPGDNSITRMLVTIQRHRFLEEFGKHPFRYGQSSHLLMRRDLYQSMGFFNPHLRMHEDKEICIRAINAGVAVNVYPEFEAGHSKIFSFTSLLKDHAHKSYLAMKGMEENPQIFRRVQNQLGPGYKASWIIGFTLPLVALTLLAMHLLSPLAAATAILLSLLSPLVLCHESFNDFAPREKLTGLLMWPFMGAAVSVPCGLALVAVRLQKTARGLRTLGTLAQLGWRVVSRNGMPVSIIHFITARCNLRCDHCFYKETLDAKDPGEQSLQQLDKTTREIGPVLWYALAGGEPFLREDLPAIHKTITDNCRPLMITMPTNAWYTDKTFLRTLEMLQQMKGGRLTIQCSIDGPQDIHDAIRGEGSWRRLKETFAKLQELQALYPELSLGIITVVSDKNHHTYPGFIDQLVREFNPNQVSINILRRTRLDGPPIPVAIVEAYRQAVERYEWHIAQKHLKAFSYLGGSVVRAKEAVQKDLIYRVARFDEFVTPCTAGTLTYTIWEDGRVNACEVLHDSIGNVLGADKGSDFRQIVSSAKARALRKKIRDTDCRCTYECAMTINTLFNPPMAAATVKQMLVPSRAAGTATPNDPA